MLTRGINVLKTIGPRRLLWMSVLFSELCSTAITSLMSIFFHGRVTRDYLITSGVVALLVSFIIALILISLIDAVRNAEERAAKESDKTRRYLDRAGFLFLIIGVDQNVVTINQKGAAILGYSEREIVGMNWFDHFIPELQREEIRSVFKKAVSGEAASVEFYENFILTRSGAEKLIAWHNTVLTDERGEVTGTLSSGEDISEYKKWEDSLQEQKKFAENLVENSAVATFVINPAHKVVLWNKACAELTGLPTSEMVGTDNQWKTFYASKRQTLADVVIDGNTESLSALYEKHARSTLNPDGLRAEGWYKSLNGKDRYIIFDAAPIYDGGGTLIAVIETLQDITEQKKLEEEVVRSKDYLRTVIDTEPECVKLVAEDGTLLEMNPAGLTMVEADSIEQVAGQQICDLVTPEYRPAFEELTRKAFQGESGSLEFEIVGLKGASRWLETRSAPLRNSQGKIFALLGVTRDITERKQAENRLQQQLQFVQRLIDTIPMPIFYKDVNGVYLGYNKAFEEFLGMPKEKLIGKTVYEVAPKELADQYYQKDKELFDRPGIQTYEFAVKHSDGAVHEVIFNKATYTDAQGNVAGLIGAMQDITGRKRVEEVIKRNYDTQAAISALLQLSLENIPLDEILKQALDLILSISWLSLESRGAMFLVDDASRTLVMKASKGLSEDLKEECGILPFGKCLCGRAAATGEVQFADSLDERHEVHYNGIIQHGHYCVPILLSGKVLGVINMYIKEGHQRDLKEVAFLEAISNALAGIIQRKSVEGEREKLIDDLRVVLDTVSHSKQEWQDTFDSITDMISIVDREFTIVKANKAFSAQLGRPPWEIIGKKCYDLFPDDEASLFHCPHGDEVAAHQPVSCEIVDKKTNRLFRVIAFPYSAPDGSILGTINIARDVTDEKEREARLIVSERLAALGQMASGIAHEINNPLASIAGCSEGLLDRVRKAQWDPRLFETYLKIIQEEVFRCKNITTGMLSFVRKATYEKKMVDINDVLEKTVEIISYQGRMKHVKIVRKYHEQALSVLGNEGELRQVFLIIITNALDAMEDKGTLTLETAQAEAGVFARIGDSGPGIPSDLEAKIFDPFFTTKAERGGTGLGLSIARKIVGNHNGSLELTSQLGTGTTFVITLPQNDMNSKS